MLLTRRPFCHRYKLTVKACLQGAVGFIGIHLNAVALASEPDAPEEASAKYEQDKIRVSAVGAVALDLISHKHLSAAKMVHSEYQVRDGTPFGDTSSCGLPEAEAPTCRRAVTCRSESYCASDESSWDSDWKNSFQAAFR